MPYRDAPQLRILLAQECARLMAEEGLTDFRAAKRKAAQRLAVADLRLLPDNQEIEQALLDYQRLFQADRQPQQLQKLREAALDAMRFLADFRPRLVGSVLSGTAGPNTTIQLHLFADTPEDVALFLMNRRIPFESSERRLKPGNGEPVSLPVFRFSAGDHDFDLTVFAPLAEREAPRSPVDGRPMRRAGPADLEVLLAESRP
ncbi:MAG: hypothetical protein QG599_3458 [Pseudomonadota bacterium]|nr:hypothetical protein [Pseudomonadota bacterium]